MTLNRFSSFIVNEVLNRLVTLKSIDWIPFVYFEPPFRLSRLYEQEIEVQAINSVFKTFPFGKARITTKAMMDIEN